ncbi:MAG: hypothetical protein K2X38_03395 [Gemmataceae bacterium]|nr:hypothetical protein [Gemmataceae bacterium]
MSLRSVSLLACLSASLLVSHPAAAQEGVKVRIPTIDGVTLQGAFYAAKNPQGKVPPTVLLVHALGEKSSKPEWVHLATSLQEKFAVMTFDFRGHGESTEIDPAKFGRYQPNVSLVKGFKPGKESIDYKDFDKAYMPILCNDLAAVKGFLDRKNDQGQCNTSTFIVVGADTGATLAAVWLNSENYRYRMVPSPNPLFPPQPPPADAASEGRSVVGCVWLSISPTLGKHQLSVSKLLDLPGKVHATPMVFMFGEEDAKGKTIGNGVVNALKKDSKDKEKFSYTGAVSVQKTKLVGAGLLAKSLGTDAAIRDWINDVVKKKNNEWLEKDQRKSVYAWRMSPATLPTIIKPAEEQNLIFDTYEKFIPR